MRINHEQLLKKAAKCKFILHLEFKQRVRSLQMTEQFYMWLTWIPLLNRIKSLLIQVITIIHPHLMIGLYLN
jgi:hypothetical protein